MLRDRHGDQCRILRIVNLVVRELRVLLTSIPIPDGLMRTNASTMSHLPGNLACGESMERLENNSKLP
jgi:hypothetical protein